MSDIILTALVLFVGIPMLILRFFGNAKKADKPLYWNQTAESAEARWNGGKS